MTDEHIVTGQDLDEPVTLSVIAPCLDEEDNIDSLVDRTLTAFDEMKVSAELILIDDGSRDRTWKRIEIRAERDGRVRGLRHSFNRGIECAWRSGLDASAGHLVCLIDADLQNRPEDIARLYRTYVREVPDIVQGVRLPTSGVRRCHLFSRGLNLMLNFAFGLKMRDSKSGFILARRDALANILRHRYAYRYYQSFIGVAAKAQGYIIAEVETTFERRNAGASFLARWPILVSARICWELLKFRVETYLATRRTPGRSPIRWVLRSPVAGATQGKP